MGHGLLMHVKAMQCDWRSDVGANTSVAISSCALLAAPQRRHWGTITELCTAREPEDGAQYGALEQSERTKNSLILCLVAVGR
ncbi:MAG TPA: hypothetical protein VKP30_05195 [Polyangiaceae bacterium]|nr:hypothetical protein [Polyangiaceae bacterium]